MKPPPSNCLNTVIKVWQSSNTKTVAIGSTRDRVELEVKDKDGRIRQLSLLIKDDDTITVFYNSHEWDWKKCKFSNYSYPSD